MEVELKKLLRDLERPFEFEGLDKCLKELKNEKKNVELMKSAFGVDNLDEIEKHITTLLKIKNWGNHFVHTQDRSFFWVPCIVCEYLQELFDSEDLRNTEKAFKLIYPSRSN